VARAAQGRLRHRRVGERQARAHGAAPRVILYVRGSFRDICARRRCGAQSGRTIGRGAGDELGMGSLGLVVNVRRQREGPARDWQGAGENGTLLLLSRALLFVAEVYPRNGAQQTDAQKGRPVDFRAHGHQLFLLGGDDLDVEHLELYSRSWWTRAAMKTVRLAMGRVTCVTRQCTVG